MTINARFLRFAIPLKISYFSLIFIVAGMVRFYESINLV